MTKTDLFLDLAKPVNGISRWVTSKEFIGKYSVLVFGNGASWARKESSLAKTYIVEFDKSISNGNSIDRVRLNGLQSITHSQHIRSDIKKNIGQQRCVVLDVSTNIEVDHKNGRKMNTGGDPRVLNSKTQTLNDFQPLSKAANDSKRQHCKYCNLTNERYDAKKMGYPISYYKGVKQHNGSITGCEGCFWYDPIEFRKSLKS